MTEIVGIQFADEDGDGLVKDVFNVIYSVGKPEYFTIEK